MKQLLLILLITFSGYSQTLIGDKLYGEVAEDIFGEHVAISSDGNTIIVSARLNDQNADLCGSAVVYKNITNVWTQVGARFYGTSYLEGVGKNVAISADGSIIAIAANKLDNGSSQSEGVVYVYQNILDNWVLLGQPILGKNYGDFAGTNIDLSSDGTIIAITSPGNDDNGSNSGQLRIFQYISNTWTQIGQDINGLNALDALGYDVSLSNNGTRVAVSAINDLNNNQTGFVKVFDYINNIWTQIGQTINGIAAEDRFGTSIALSGNGNTLIIGATGSDVNGSNSGAVSIYDYVSNNWVQAGQTIYGTSSFGWEVSITEDGNIIATGSLFINYYKGQIKIFQRNSNNWIQIGNNIDGDFNYDNFGTNMISSDGTTIITGAQYNDFIGSNAGQVKVYDLTSLLNSNGFVQANFLVYPNPTYETLTIELKNNLELKKVNFYNTLGQIVKTSKNTTTNVSDLAKGTYFVEIITNQGKATKTIVIE
ncbi:T9SS type A sorting domain-containing protein [Flavobacterium sp. N2270]|uniref:T9SS type A sorting domain-containing protein n=1 Tax=Flavobacterium sp. N2270 TaxID=2986831 RepID=UPI002224326A|nr:T9SS type A sorting domain-containing protein [Flavobacterium sp. N2270]